MCVCPYACTSVHIYAFLCTYSNKEEVVEDSFNWPGISAWIPTAWRHPCLPSWGGGGGDGEFWSQVSASFSNLFNCLGRFPPFLGWNSQQQWNCSVVSDSLWPHGLYVACQALPFMGYSGKNTGVKCHFLLQGIFLTQGSNSGLPHCRQTLYHLSHQGIP